MTPRGTRHLADLDPGGKNFIITITPIGSSSVRPALPFYHFFPAAAGLKGQAIEAWPDPDHFATCLQIQLVGSINWLAFAASIAAALANNA